MLAAGRYDGGSGSALFSGVIPLKPGQFLEEGLAGSAQTVVTLWADGIELGCYASCLYPQHPDGSVKSLQISAMLELNVGVQRPLELRLDTPQTITGPVAHPTINRAWMQNPVLIACTDPYHLCEARAAFGPLVPLAELDGTWAAFLVAEFENGHDHFPTYRVAIQHLRGSGTIPANYPWQNANYNAIAPLYYRYLMTGSLDNLVDAHRLAANDHQDAFTWNPSGGGSINYGNGPIVRYHGAYEGHAANDPFPIDEYGQAFNTAPIGTGEHQSGFRQSAWMCYVLSGWAQPLGVLISFGIRSFTASQQFSPFPNYPWPNIGPGAGGGPSGFHSPSAPGGWSGGRFNFRLYREADAFLYMLRLPMDLNASVFGPFMAPTSRSEANRVKYRTLFQRKYYDSIDLWSTEFAPTGQVNSFLYGLWGFSPYFPSVDVWGNVQGTYPSFQIITLFNALALVYMNIVEDPRFIPKMVQLAEFLLTQIVSSAVITHPAAAGRPPVYRMPYMTTDPASAGSALSPNFYTPGMLLALWAWAYRVTGDLRFKEIADAHASIYAMAHPSPSSGIGHAFKQLGETYHMAAYAAAWMKGETWGTGAGVILPARPAALRILQRQFQAA